MGGKSETLNYQLSTNPLLASIELNEILLHRQRHDCYTREEAGKYRKVHGTCAPFRRERLYAGRALGY